VRRFDRCLVISETDQRELDPDDRLDNIRLNPHGIDPNKFAPAEDAVKEPGALIFSGKMDYDPNVDAAVYFCKDIFPLIKRKRPDAKVYIVGINPKPPVAALARDPSVIVTGFVPDMRPYMDRAQVALDPLRIGAGLQNKVLENMSMGLPLVMTTVANEGIRAKDGRDALIADAPQLFADHVVRLLDDEPLRRQFGAAARDFVVDGWSWEKHFDDLEQIFDELVSADRESIQDRQSHLLLTT
jgi:glycosyltransferase involved in cell wall biosynthesis